MTFPRFHIDFEQGILAVETTWDVRITELPTAFQGRKVGIQRAVLDIEADQLLLFLSEDIAATIELGVTEPRASDRLRGRRIVYLDQNSWSTMAAWRHGHRPIAPREAEAAERLYELVLGEEVVLPLSGGHAVETGPMYDVRRVAHAATLMELSRGWQMRNPVAVRTEELACSLRGEAPIASDVFCLGSDVLFTQRLREFNVMDAPELLASASPRIVNLLSVYSALLDAEPIDNSDGLRKAEAWAQGFQELGERMRHDGVSREMAQRIAHGNVLWDLHAELLSIATPDELEPWWSRSHDDVSRMPYLSRYRALLFARLRNSTAPWKASDLTDLNFLCCAAGYADVVVGERRTIGDLETARRVPSGSSLARNLSEAVDLLEVSRDAGDRISRTRRPGRRPGAGSSVRGGKETVIRSTRR